MSKHIHIVNLVVLVTLSLNNKPARAHALRLDSVVRRGETSKKSNFYGNPLTLDGKPLNYGSFSLSSRGTLAVVDGDPESKETTKIPFRIYLVRAGNAVTSSVSDNTQPVYYDIEVAAVLALARPGDDLVIEPARKTDLVAKRVIKLRPLNSCLPPSWLFFPINGVRPGC
ncbi:hypothetical protein GO755_14895 [Spirosoma sp. HMF4905]|uniref:Uncharacterized protein n=1 Tax=Spirosoma arboris TaxID=2682092 RepID=A0A7K1SC10_9BACT|nr:hypothetical protein [Spirosoma arboris]MVM31329.1 hypothetical protein [Spirosoma arboris]